MPRARGPQAVGGRGMRPAVGKDGAAGLNWYPRARTHSRKLARQHGADRGAAVGAVDVRGGRGGKLPRRGRVAERAVERGHASARRRAPQHRLAEVAAIGGGGSAHGRAVGAVERGAAQERLDAVRRTQRLVDRGEANFGVVPRRRAPADPLVGQGEGEVDAVALVAPQEMVDRLGDDAAQPDERADASERDARAAVLLHVGDKRPRPDGVDLDHKQRARQVIRPFMTRHSPPRTSSMLPSTSCCDRAV
ncbi:MAG: hypothetical protein J3K34DRAFT_418081 [Monoraphidium minutum]|nr:MAG: hypothetical protein J3K34DRAFT_418081 [Monoraphidium minutum]